MIAYCLVMSPLDEALIAAEPVDQFGYEPEEIRTEERTGAARLKWVVIVDRSLSPGQTVNAAICVAAATAPAVPGLLGPGARDASGTWHYGLPWAGCSVLGAEGSELAALRERAIAQGLHVADMPSAAQATRVYDDYLATLSATEADALQPLALSVIGPRNQVAKLVRRLELLP
jgi:hypothetical protein